jgi:hypothetical protein
VASDGGSYDPREYRVAFGVALVIAPGAWVSMLGQTRRVAARAEA